MSDLSDEIIKGQEKEIATLRKHVSKLMSTNSDLKKRLHKVKPTITQITNELSDARKSLNMLTAERSKFLRKLKRAGISIK